MKTSITSYQNLKLEKISQIRNENSKFTYRNKICKNGNLKIHGETTKSGVLKSMLSHTNTHNF